MIRIGNEVLSQTPPADISNDPVKRLTFKILTQSSKVYTYPSMEALLFELEARAFIVDSSKSLYQSKFSFAVFDESKCNTEYWTRTNEGGFRLRPGQSAYKAIRNILEDSRDYATECSTAIVIVFYLGLTRSLSEQVFNRLFTPIYLMNWTYLDKDLGIQSFKNIKDPLPGDCLYVENPDFNPETPEWRGENVIMLNEEMYYGHGIGIKTIDGFIHDLNRNRRPGSTHSAYLSSSVTRPDYRYLYSQSNR